MDTQELLGAIEGLRHRIYDTEPGFASKQDPIVVKGQAGAPIGRKTALCTALLILGGAERCAQRDEKDHAHTLLGMAMGILFTHKVRMMDGVGDYELERAEVVLEAMLNGFRPVRSETDDTHGAFI